MLKLFCKRNKSKTEERVAGNFRKRLSGFFILKLSAILLMLFFGTIPSSASAATGPDKTDWYPIGPISSRGSLEDWTNKLYNRYWELSGDAKSYFINNSALIKDKSLIDFFPDYYDAYNSKIGNYKVAVDQYGKKVYWSYDRKYGNISAWYDDKNDLWWSELRLALFNPDAKINVYRINDYVVGTACGNITNPTQRYYPWMWGFKFEDKNADSVQNWGEPTLAGWNIRLVDTDTGRTLLTTTTDSNGYYKFELSAFKGLISYPKRVRLEEELKSGWTNTLTPDEFLIYDSDTVGIAYKSKYFGNFKNAKISGRKYIDKNGDGEKQYKEDFKNDWWIVLRLKSTGEQKGRVKTYTKNGVDGYYEFTNLPPGTYTVEEELKDNWVQTQPATEKYTIKVNESGKNYSGYFFGNFKEATIKGNKYKDVNGDGKKQSSEPYLNGWKIVLKQGTKERDSMNTKTITNSNGTKMTGAFEFTGLGPGTYTLHEELNDNQKEAGWIKTYPENPGKHTITVNESGKTYGGYLFGNFNAKITGRKFHDKDGNGKYNDNDTYENGWTIKLTNKDTKKKYTTTTDTIDGKVGTYEFKGLKKGTYTVEEVLKDGWVRTTPNNPAKHTVEVDESKTYWGYNFGNFQKAKIVGIKYEDVNANGSKQTSERTLGGWKIKLTNEITGKKAYDTTSYGSSSPTGFYEFTGLGPGTYTVEEEVKDNWVKTEPVSPGKYTVTVDESGKTYKKDDKDKNLYFGNFKGATIQGRKYNDKNNNGIHDIDDETGEEEPYMDGWTIKLSKHDWQTTSVTYTRKIGGVNYPGSYVFKGLGPGTYTVEEELLDDKWENTQPGPSEDPEKNYKYTIKVESGQIYKDNDFGNHYIGRARISSRKYHDFSGDGLYQPGEPFLNGWTIVLKKDGIQYREPVVTYTDEQGLDGYYEFDDLDAGMYTVEEIPTQEQFDEGWRRTEPESGIHEIEVEEGEVYSGYNFGNFLGYGSITGRKYDDTDKSGGWNDEPYLNGWKINLYKVGGNGGDEDEEDGEPKPYRSTITTTAYDANGEELLGYYEFLDLPAGEYTIEEEPTADQIDEGWEKTQPAEDGYPAVVEPNQSYGDYLFGNHKVKKSTISGHKYNDRNANGKHDIEFDEPYLNGWTINLYKADQEGEEPYKSTITTTSYDEEGRELQGYFEFKGLDPGDYIIEEEMTEEQTAKGWMPTQPVGGSYEISVSEGEDKGGYLFGNFRPTNKITGQKFEDTNGNGLYDGPNLDNNGNTEDGEEGTEEQNENTGSGEEENENIFAGEPHLSGWTIILKRDGQTVAFAVTGTTDGKDGYYEFDDVEPGIYTVEEELKNGWTNTYPDGGIYLVIVGETPQTYAGYDFGNFENVNLSGRKFEDINGNGEYNEDEQEPYINGWTIVLKKEGDTDFNRRMVTTTAFGGDGYYEFTDLGPGVYTIEEEVQDEWTRTQPEGGIYRIKVESGQIYSGYDFGNFENGRISGRKYEDTDGDGTRVGEGEPYLNGWTIVLEKDGLEYGRIDTSDKIEEGGALPGYYEFTNLPRGTYTVKELLKDGWITTQPESKEYEAIIDKSGQEYSDLNFGNFELIKITGRKYEDENGNGRWDFSDDEEDDENDRGEPFLNGWEITLTREDDPTFYQSFITTTSVHYIGTVAYEEDGYYEFKDLGPGTYTVEEVLKDDWTNTEPTTGKYIIEAKSGENSANNFGNFRDVNIRGRKFEDINGNHEYDEGEPYLNGWNITLKKEGDPEFVRSMVTTTSAEGKVGYCEFTDLGPGTYTIEEDVINDLTWFQTKPVDPDFYKVTLTSGQDIDGLDFGNFKYGSISGYKWHDTNENGLRDDGELPLEGWEIILSKKGSTEKRYEYTDAQGYYRFDYLKAGKYFITENLKDGWRQTFPIEPDYHTVTITSGSVFENKNFGNFKYGRKSGYKWNDRYPDGEWDRETEEGLNDWEIALLKEDPVTHEYKTVSIEITRPDDEGQDGYYEFNRLRYGRYRVVEILKDGWKQTHPATEDEGRRLIPGYYEFFVESGFVEEGNNFGNWNYDSFGKTKGYWQTWEKAKRYSYDQMQVFVDYINANSTVYGEEPFSFGNLTVEEIVDRLMTNNNEDHLKDTKQALALLEAQFLATWLNIAAGFQNPEMVVHLDKVKGAKEIYGADKLPLKEVIRITEENIRKYKEFGEGEIGDEYWGRAEFLIAQKVFTMVNEAEDDDGYIFRPKRD